jgi:hypothetical protein
MSWDNIFISLLCNCVHNTFSFIRRVFFHVDICRRIILKWVLKKYNVKMWTEFKQLRIVSSDRFLWTYQWTFDLKTAVSHLFLTFNMSVDENVCIACNFYPVSPVSPVFTENLRRYFLPVVLVNNHWNKIWCLLVYEVCLISVADAEAEGRYASQRGGLKKKY